MIFDPATLLPEMDPGRFEGTTGLTVAPSVPKPSGLIATPPLTAELVGQVIKGLSELKFRIPGFGEITEITFFDPAQALEFLDITLPEGFRLKLIPGEARGTFTISQIDPQGWELTQEGLFISPEGQTFTRDEIEAFGLEEPEAPVGALPVAPVGPLLAAPTIEPIDLERLLQELFAQQKKLQQQLEAGLTAGIPRSELQDVIDELAAIQVAIGTASQGEGVARTQLDAEVTNLITDWRTRFADNAATYFQVAEEIRVVFPEITDEQTRVLLGRLPQEARDLIETIWPDQFRAVIAGYDFGGDEKQVFFTALLRRGRSTETEDLLKFIYPDITESQMRNIFGEALILPIDTWAEGRNQNLWPWETAITSENQNEDWAQTEYANYIKAVKASPDWARKLETGYGNLISVIGSGARWLGAGGIADRLQNVSAEHLAMRTADLEPERFNWDDIYTGILENLPTQIALMGTSILAFIGTQGLLTPVMGAFARYILAALSSTAISRTFEGALEAGGTYDAWLLKHPGDIEGAKDAADKVFRNNFLLAGVDFLQIAAIFAPGGRVVVNSAIVRGFIRVTRNPAGKILSISITEGGEEFLQEYWTRTALGEEVVLDNEMRLVISLGAIMGGIFGGGGVLYQSFQDRVQANLTPEQRTQFDADVEEATIVGNETPTEEAFNKLSETAEGKKVIDNVAEVTKMENLERAITPEGEVEQAAHEALFDKINAELPDVKPLPYNFETRLKAELQKEFTAPTTPGVPTEARVAEPVSDLSKGAWVEVQLGEPARRITGIGEKRVTLVDVGGNKTTIPISQEVYLTEAPISTPEDVEITEPREGGESLGAMRWDEFHRNPSESEQAIREQLVDFIEQKVPKNVQAKLLRDVAKARTFADLDRAINKANRLTENFRTKEYKTWLRQNHFADTSKLEEPTPDAVPVDKLVRLLREAIPARVETEQLKHEALSKKAAMYAQALKSNSGQEAFQKAKRSLGGALPSLDLVLDFAGAHMTKVDIDALFDQISTSNLRPFQKLNTAEALMKILSGNLPTAGELVRLENMFGKELGKAIMSHRSLGQKIWWEVLNILNIPRAILASFDLSFPLRQGALLVWGQPYQAAAMFKPGIQAAFSAKTANIIENAAKEDEFAGLREDAWLDTPPLELVSYRLGAGEEGFQTGWAEKIPGVAWSQRAFVVMGNVLRRGVFNYWAAKWKGDPTKTMKDYRALASMINDFTGRGKLPKAMEGWAAALNAGFFAPRLQFGRVRAPFHLFSKSKAVRMVAARNITAFIAGNMMMISLAILAGAKVEWDARSPDFAKIRFGNTRIDYWAGFQQYARFIANMVTGEQVTSGTGREYDVNYLTTIGRFIQSKLAPVPGLIIDLLKGETFLGEDFEGMTEEEGWNQVRNRIVPMFIQDLWDAMEEQGMTGLFTVWPAFFGASAQTYDTANWNELHSKIGLPAEDVYYPYSSEVHIYNTKDWFQDVKNKLHDLTLEDMAGNRHLFNDNVFFIAEVRDLDKKVDNMSGEDMWSLNSNIASGDTYIQFNEQWKLVQRLNADPEALEEFMKANDGKTPEQIYPSWYKGNLTQTEIVLLNEYHSLSDDEQAAFRELHPEMRNPRRQYLVSHPEENARLALFGQQDIYTREAFDKMKELQAQYDIPDSALLDVGLPPDHLVNTYYDWLDLGVSSSSREGKLFRLNNSEFSEWYEGVRGLQPVDPTTRRILELQDEFKDELALRESYGTVGSLDYIEDQELRSTARQKQFDDNPEFDKAWHILATGFPPDNLMPIYNDWLGLDISAASREGKLFRLNNPEFSEWLEEVNELQPVDESGRRVLEVYDTFNEEFSLRDGYGNVDSPDFIPDPDVRDEAYKRQFEDNPAFERAWYTLNFYGAQDDRPLLTDEHLDTYITYYTQDDLQGAGYANELFLMANWDFTMAMRWSGGAFESPDGSNWKTVPTQAVWDLWLRYDALRKPDGSADSAARRAFKEAHPTLWAWKNWVNAPRLPRSQYLEWYRLGLKLSEGVTAPVEEVEGREGESQRPILEAIVSAAPAALDLVSQEDRVLLDEVMAIMRNLLNADFPEDTRRLELIDLLFPLTAKYIDELGSRNVVSDLISRLHDFLQDIPAMSQDEFLMMVTKAPEEPTTIFTPPRAPSPPISRPLPR